MAKRNLLLGIVLLLILAACQQRPAVEPAPAALQATGTATLVRPHQGATNPGFGTGSCPGSPRTVRMALRASRSGHRLRIHHCDFPGTRDRSVLMDRSTNQPQSTPTCTRPGLTLFSTQQPRSARESECFCLTYPRELHLRRRPPQRARRPQRARPPRPVQRWRPRRRMAVAPPPRRTVVAPPPRRTVVAPPRRTAVTPPPRPTAGWSPPPRPTAVILSTTDGGSTSTTAGGGTTLTTGAPGPTTTTSAGGTSTTGGGDRRGQAGGGGGGTSTSVGGGTLTTAGAQVTTTVAGQTTSSGDGATTTPDGTDSTIPFTGPPSGPGPLGFVELALLALGLLVVGSGLVLIGRRRTL